MAHSRIPVSIEVMPPLTLRRGWLVLRALIRLRQVHRGIRRQPFDRVCATLGARPVEAKRNVDTAAAVAAVDRASAWFVVPSNCFHRSATLASLLRDMGVDAHVICGIRTRPLEGHAWVEVSGEVVNDDPAVKSQYTPVLWV